MKVLILGIGHICKAHYLKWIASSELVTSIYLFDKFLPEDQIRDYLIHSGFERFSRITFFILPASESHLNVIRNINPDKVFVLTNNTSHYPLASVFLEHGIDVLVEKPASLNYAEFAQLCNYAEQTKSLFFPAYHQFYRSETYEALRLLTNAQTCSTDITLHLRAGSSSNYPAHQLAGGFSLKSHAGGGVLLDLGSHYISLAFLFLRHLGISSATTQFSEVNVSFGHSGLSPTLFVENHCNATLASNRLLINLEFSYLKKSDPGIDVLANGEVLMSWPKCNTKYSNMVFKNMTDYFLSASLDSLDPHGEQPNSYLSGAVMPAIGQAIHLIDFLYASHANSDQH